MKQKILFLHGLESSNKGKKVDFLKERAEVLAPKIDYQDEALEEKLMYIVENFRPDFIIGSSMGGYVGMLLANKYGIKNLLYNPAIHSRSIEPKLNRLPKNWLLVGVSGKLNVCVDTPYIPPMSVFSIAEISKRKSTSCLTSKSATKPLSFVARNIIAIIVLLLVG